MGNCFPGSISNILQHCFLHRNNIKDIFTYLQKLSLDNVLQEKGGGVVNVLLHNTKLFAKLLLLFSNS